MEIQELLKEIRACTVCEAHLPHGPRPVLQAGSRARLLIIGQAPGRRVHETGIPWNDPSGDTLRDWLQIPKETFYDAERVSIVPTGFCYPGKGLSGDLPPRPECVPLWHPRLLQQLPEVRLTLLIGAAAQSAYLREHRKPTLTATVKAFSEYLPRYLPLPHPSPRNRFWLARNPWFQETVLPVLREQTRWALSGE